MLLGTVSLWALNFTVSKYILDEGFRPLAYSAVRYGCAALVFVAITLAWEGSLRIGRGELALAIVCTGLLFANQLSFVYALKFTTATTVALVFGTLPIFTAILARGSGMEHLSGRTNLLWFTAINRVGPSRASLFANLQPFLAAIIALLLLSEQITTVQVVGGLAIGGGIALASRRGPAPEPPAE